MTDFRCIYLPYCLLKHDSGGYLILNRDYKPLGFSTTKHLTYEDYPIEAKFLRMSKTTAAKLSYEKSDNLDRIFLYNDGCIPTSSEQNMKQYLEKLKILAKLKIKDNRREYNHFVEEKTGKKYKAYGINSNC